MTPECVKDVLKLQELSNCDIHEPNFTDLTIEQLLYAAIVAVGIEEVQTVLDTVDWSKWCPNVSKVN